LTWNEWGAKETTLNRQTEDKITVNASFSYNVSMEFEFGFQLAGVKLANNRIPAISLDWMEFPGNISMMINTIGSYEEAYTSGYENGTDDGYDLGYDDGYDDASEGLPNNSTDNGTPSLGFMAIVITFLVVVQVYRKKRRPD
jgi:hypothetical protein